MTWTSRGLFYADPTVVGVAAQEFRGVYAVYFAPDVWVPITMLPRLIPAYRQALESRDNSEFRMIGRLRPAATVEQAQAAVRVIAGRLETACPTTNKGIKAFAFRELDTRPEVEVADAANGIAMRAALGASRVDLVRQLLVESVLLALVAGAIGLIVGAAASHVVASFSVPTDIPKGPFLEVVGVAADGKYRQLTEQPRPYVFLDFAQNASSRSTLVAAYRGDLGTTVEALRRAVKAIDPAMPIFETKTMAQHKERAMMGPRLSAALAGPAGLLAAIIAALGLYGVMAYSVSRRTQEVGIRVAMGAGPFEILSLMMRQGLTLAVIGIAIELAVAWASSSLVSILLFGVTPTDPVVFVSVPALLAGVAALACYIPARRALKIDPLVALKQE